MALSAAVSLATHALKQNTQDPRGGIHMQTRRRTYRRMAISNQRGTTPPTQSPQLRRENAMRALLHGLFAGLAMHPPYYRRR
jgi:hypothetical protein